MVRSAVKAKGYYYQNREAGVYSVSKWMVCIGVFDNEDKQLPTR